LAAAALAEQLHRQVTLTVLKAAIPYLAALLLPAAGLAGAALAAILAMAALAVLVAAVVGVFTTQPAAREIPHLFLHHKETMVAQVKLAAQQAVAVAVHQQPEETTLVATAVLAEMEPRQVFLARLLFTLAVVAAAAGVLVSQPTLAKVRVVLVVAALVVGILQKMLEPPELSIQAAAVVAEEILVATAQQAALASSSSNTLSPSNLS